MYFQQLFCETVIYLECDRRGNDPTLFFSDKTRSIKIFFGQNITQNHQYVELLLFNLSFLRPDYI